MIPSSSNISIFGFREVQKCKGRISIGIRWGPSMYEVINDEIDHFVNYLKHNSTLPLVQEIFHLV